MPKRLLPLDAGFWEAAPGEEEVLVQVALACRAAVTELRMLLVDGLNYKPGVSAPVSLPASCALPPVCCGCFCVDAAWLGCLARVLGQSTMRCAVPTRPPPCPRCPPRHQRVAVAALTAVP
eukprot:1894833-Rhodomonas_salina.1